MRICDRFIKLNRTETADIIDWCLAVLLAYRAPNGAESESLYDRMNQAIKGTRRDALARRAKFLLLGLTRRHDLWAERFWDIVRHRDDFVELFGIDQPVWFFDQTMRSQSRDLWRGLSHDEAHEVRAQVNRHLILDIAGKSGVDLNRLGLGAAAQPVNCMILSNLVRRWRDAEAEKSRKTRQNRKTDRQAGKAAVEAIPADTTEVALRARIAELTADNAAKDRTISRLAGERDRRAAYEEAKEKVIEQAALSPLVGDLANAQQSRDWFQAQMLAQHERLIEQKRQIAELTERLQRQTDSALADQKRELAREVVVLRNRVRELENEVRERDLSKVVPALARRIAA